jgi:hypothetical protein
LDEISERENDYKRPNNAVYKESDQNESNSFSEFDLSSKGMDPQLEDIIEESPTSSQFSPFYSNMGEFNKYCKNQ